MCKAVVGDSSKAMRACRDSNVCRQHRIVSSRSRSPAEILAIAILAVSFKASAECASRWIPPAPKNRPVLLAGLADRHPWTPPLSLRGGMPVFFQSFGGGGGGGGFPGGAQFFSGGFPGGFEGMGGMGGMGGQGQGGPPQSDNTKYYKQLGIEKDADETEIKKAYKRAAIKNHPDKGGDPEKFKEISHAYEILSDPEKRKLYDQYGEDAVKDGGGGGAGVDPFDIFNSFFGGGGGGGGSRQRKTQDVVHKLAVPLEEMYNGATKKLALNRHIADSQGRVTKKKEVLEVRIERGMEDGRKIVFKEKADEMPGAITGDVILVVQQMEHRRFKRQGPHMTMEKEITLREALCGYKFAFNHLDKRQVVVTSAKGAVTEPGTWVVVPGEGMPIKGNQFNKGNLFIRLTVRFPRATEVSPEALKEIGARAGAGGGRGGRGRGARGQAHRRGGDRAAAQG
eukprot:CAMPEP_0172175338 /NCGR_PEP_ID=MMETSP1050-20130122/14171_1 /TAXON_ID=233186 /ORGANISM="Cryptomonas curvata, Strain CCAP979/52" /LENGTH=452 /DNA_ID=CAMNT_0012847427 /DNA_START=1 /DNA_END=1355 /DNA_ORIENTATION=+